MTTTTITVMFTDLVGSTDLLARKGEAAAEELRREHVGVLRAAIDDAGGHEVKNLGDGLMVAFSGPAAALACAVSIQQRLAARPAGAEPLPTRIGISAGEVDAVDGDYFGIPVVEAARLCALAGGGEVLVTEMARLLARSRSDVEMESIGELALKGLPDPVATHRVRWEPLPSAAQVPLPDRLGTFADRAFVGRVDESSTMTRAFDEAAAGRRQVVLVGGEPGIGKTALVAAAASAASREGAWVLYGRCDEDLFVPYQPWVEALSHLVAHCPDDLKAEHLADRGRVLSRLVPDLDGRTRDAAPAAVDDDAERHLLFDAVEDLLRRAADVAPVVLVLDDLQWADEATLQVLRHVAGAAGPQRLLVLGTFRSSEVDRDGTLAETLASLHRVPGVARLAVDGLGGTDLLALLETLAGQGMQTSGVALRDAVLVETDGNPFFATELLRHLVETGDLCRDDGGNWHVTRDVARTGLPVSIREVVASRVRRLGPETERLLTVAAVIGRDIEVDLLAEVAGIAEDRVVDLCDAAVEAAVLHETAVVDRYTFAHALVERTLHDSLSATRRARTHRAVAEALDARCGEDPGDRVGALAHHWSHASGPDAAERAVHFAGMAGRRALRQLAPAEAVRWFTEALARLPDGQRADALGIDLRIGLGEAERLVGRPEHRVTLLEAAEDARTAGLPDLLVRAALANSDGKANAIGQVDDERVAILGAALDAVGPHDSIERARLLAVLSAELSFEPGGSSTTVAAEAVAMARRVGDPQTFVVVVAECSAGLVVPEHLQEHLVDVAEVARIADASGDPTLGVLAHWSGGFAAADAGRRDELAEHALRLRAAAERTGIGTHRWFAAHMAVLDALFGGDLAAVDAALTEYQEIGNRSGKEADTLTQAAAMIVTLAFYRGELGPVIPMVEFGREHNPGLPVYSATLAWAHALEDDLVPARRLLDEARADDFALPRDFIWTTGQCLWMQVAHVLGDRAAASVLLERLEPLGHMMACSHASVIGAVRHYVGLGRMTVGDLDRAVEDLERAVELHRSVRAPHLVAMSECSLAAALATTGDGDDLARARTLAAAALRAADDGGYGYVRRDAAALLDRIG